MRYALLLVVALSTVAISSVLPTITLAAQTNAAQLKTVTLTVQNMTCGSCPFIVRKSLERVPGVVDAKADLYTKTATVTFDPDKTNVDTLTQATTNAGFPSTVKDE